MFFTKLDRERMEFELNATRERFEALEDWCDKQQATIDDLAARFQELYKHLKIHRAYVNETPARYELREGCVPLSPWSFAWPTNMGVTTTGLAVPAKPAKKRRKRKKA